MQRDTSSSKRNTSRQKAYTISLNGAWRVRLSILTFLFLLSLSTSAQTTQSLADNIRTIQLMVNGQWGQPPVLDMKGGYIDISFDDLQRRYVRYTYRITHCTADWQPSDLYYGDYMTGQNGTTIIKKYTPSRNTMTQYNHYELRLPNSEHRLLLSGNYKVEIVRATDDEVVAVVCFSICTNEVSIGATISANTDVDTYESHQQMDLEINYQHLSVSDATNELKPLVMQNRRWDTRVTGIKPSYVQVNKLIYTHHRHLIFPAANEYRRFEILDPHVATKGVERMRFDDQFYHAFIYTDEVRRNYKYDEDQNGRYLIRNDDNEANDTESDYFITHFALKVPELEGGKLYINGDLTEGQFTDDYMLDYNADEQQYEIALSLKQGSYNYQYLFLPEGTDYGLTAPTEGDYHQTENEYQIYVYQHPVGSRYDKLVGFKTVVYKE